MSFVSEFLGSVTIMTLALLRTDLRRSGRRLELFERVEGHLSLLHGGVRKRRKGSE